jgi:hypothetical protein
VQVVRSAHVGWVGVSLVVRVNNSLLLAVVTTVGGVQLLLPAGQAGVTLITEFSRSCVLQSVLETSLGIVHFSRTCLYIVKY